MQPIEQARQQGIKDDEILGYLSERFPDISSNIQEAVGRGFSDTEVLDYINSSSPVLLRGKQQVEGGKPLVADRPERGLVPSFKRGMAGSVSGLLTGQAEQVAPEDEGFGEGLAELAGGLIGDIPAMSAGGVIGGAAGTAIAPGPGTIVGAGAGSFALPAMIKQTFAEYRDYARGGGRGTFGEFLERAASVGASGAKGAALGALTSQASKLIPVLKRMPRFAKLLDTKIGKALEEPAAELATLTAGEAAIEGKLPTPSDIGKNIFAIAGFRLSGASVEKARNLAKKYTPFEAAARVSSKKELERMQDTETLTKDQTKIIDSEIGKRESAAENRDKVAAKAKKIGVNFAKNLNSLLPENVQAQTLNIANDISNRIDRRNDKVYKKKLDKLVSIHEEYAGKQRGEFVRSHYKWQEALDRPITNNEGKKVRLSDENLSDMIYYRQRTKNPNIKDDSFDTLSKRLPKEAKTIVDTVVDDYFEGWLKRWNDNPATLKKINPRDVIEDVYLPGLYTETSKIRYADAIKKADKIVKAKLDKDIRNQFETEGPFTNKKAFRTYVDALETLGLKPKYNNIKELLQYHDEMMIRLENNNELLAKLKEHEVKTDRKLIINSNDAEAYELAKKNGWKPFEDKFLRTIEVPEDPVKAASEKSTNERLLKERRDLEDKNIDPRERALMERVEADRIASGESKPKDKPKDVEYMVSPDRALVDPAFAKVFQGVFSKEAYKPEHPFWKAYDTVGNLMKVMRVSLSTFHPTALSESAFGGLGTKFITENWWKQASESFRDVDKMAWRAEMGLNAKIPDLSTYKEGQEFFDDFSKDSKNKAINLAKTPLKTLAKMTKKSHKWIFEEYQPRIKVFTFDKYLADIVGRKAADGVEITQDVINSVGRDVAEVVNNQFGGQNWELMTKFNLNDPKVQKWFRRAVGFPDWGISAIKQASNAFLPGIKGDLAREYWIRYGLTMMSFNYLMRFMYGGLRNKEDDKPNSFTWDAKKAFKTLETKDPNALYSFPLPDVNFKISGVKFNPGRDEKGRRLYSHAGKQALEIPRYALDTFDSIFGKSNPLIQSTFKQLMSGTPYKGELFPARGKYKAGSFLPWDATRPNTPGRLVSRGKEFFGEFIPFSFKGLSDKGIASTLAIGGGALPIRKGLSLKGSETYLYDALKNKNPRKLKEIVDVLKDGGYTMKQIRSRIWVIKNSWVPNERLDDISRKAKSKK